MTVFRNLTILALMLLMLGSCTTRRNPLEPVFDPELMNMSAEQIFQKAEELRERGKHTRARTYYTYVYQNYPNDPLGRRSLLQIADTYFDQGGLVNLIEAQYKYRDFINRYPGSEFADYAMFQIANVSYKQMGRPDRDLTKTRETVTKYREMLTAYPNSRHKEEAQKRLQEALDRLARHEHIVARFYMKRGNNSAAVGRLNHLIDEYADYAHKDEAFFDLGVALTRLGRTGEARLYFERVISEFPSSDVTDRAREKLKEINA